MNCRYSIILFFFAILTFNSSAHAKPAPNPQDDINNVTLEDLLKVTVASKKAMSTNEAPGIITVITHDDIVASGARDLDDVLSLVPGFQFAVDYEGTVGVGLRGLWGIEGKLLAMVDGQMQNELFYGSFMIFNQFPLDQIDRIEIIRGPGSVIYGGSAEYAVMNIITRSGKQIQGAEAKATHGQLDGTYGRNNLSVAVGKTLGNAEMSLSLFAGQEQRSNKSRSYPDGENLSMKGAYVNTPQYLNYGLTLKNISARFIASRNSVKAQDNTYLPIDSAVAQGFNQYNANIKIDQKINDKITFSPELSWAHSSPYYLAHDIYSGGIVPAFGTIPFTIYVDRYTVNAPANIEVNDKLNILAGATYFTDIAHSGDKSELYTDPTNVNSTTTKVTYTDLSFYLQGILNTEAGNFTLGARHEHHSFSGSSFVPRVAWTKSISNLNIKALYSNAFRNPSPGDINDAAQGGISVHAEKTRSAEVEFSYVFRRGRTLSVNIFETVVKGPMVYDSNNNYINSTQTGSRGFEIETKKKYNHWQSAFTASYYNSKANSTTPNYAVAQDASQLAGFAPVTLTFSAKIDLSRRLKLNPWLVYLSHRYTFYDDTNAGALSTRGVPETTLANLFLNYDDFITKNLTLGAGLFNIFNERYEFLTAYDLGRNPMPGNSREAVVSLAYNINF